MLNISQEMEHIHDLIHQAYYQCSALKTVVIDQNEASPHYSGELDKLVTGLERTVMRARHLSEFCYMDVQPMEKTEVDYAKHWREEQPVGDVEVDGNGWLHITLNTLLPHCKKGSSPWLRDTLTRLLYGYQQDGRSLPWYDRAMLVIDEHCNLENRRVFDQDNKAWKMIPNVLKGLVIDDDDQHTLSVSLVSTWDDIPSCHIYVMDAADAVTYFALYSDDCGACYCR